MSHAEPEAADLGDDSVIIERSWREAEQFAVLFDRHAPRICGPPGWPSGSRDLVAETFLAAFAKRRQYCTGYRDAAPWLYGIATKLIGQQRRDEVRQFRTQRAAIADLDMPGHADRASADPAGCRLLPGHTDQLERLFAYLDKVQIASDTAAPGDGILAGQRGRADQARGRHPGRPGALGPGRRSPPRGRGGGRAGPPGDPL